MMKFLAVFFFSAAFALSPETALKQLMEGNERYASDLLAHPDRTSERREELKAGQTPFATIVGCSDSRVPPEIIFDQGLGDLFIVRDAGNVIGPVEQDSVDYSAKFLGSSLVVVMGHEACGAIKAVLAGQVSEIEAVAALIQPNVRKNDSVEAATKSNVRAMVSALRQNPYMKKLIAEKKIDVVGAYYHLGTGRVELLR